MPRAVHTDRGSEGRCTQGAALIEGLAAEVVMGDTAYDADHLRQAIVPTQQPVTGAQISARQASLRPAISCGMLLQPAQAVPTRRNPFRKNRPKLLRRRHRRSHLAMDAISVHTT